MPAFDLDRHGVVEASAGTGKTYTLETLVRELLLEGKARLDQILLVTFTEKATGELKARLRDSLERALDAYPDRRELIQEALDQFDQAHIYTIHAFCQRVLEEYAFEHGQDFRLELVNDAGLLRRCLREVQRCDWPREHGERLQTVLELAGYPEKGGEQWEKTVLSVAGRYRPGFGQRLLTDASDEWQEDLPDDERRSRFLARTIRQVRDHLVRYKNERGLRSFDDILLHMEAGLDQSNPGAEALLRALRGQFRYAIIDEFQDTDPVQWRIFKRIFVAGGQGRLFVVGDPKQAIFNFRGADLHTYFRAVNELKTQHGARERPLTINWRSDANLLKPLNQLFQGSNWFAGSDITYVPVRSPETEQPNQIVKDTSGRAPVTLLDYMSSRRLSEARRRNARFVAAEIQRVLGINGNGPLLELSLKGKSPRPLQASDIGVLVFKHSETVHLAKQFRATGIPFSYYKQRGLWQSEEVDHVEFVLRALARPEEQPAFHRALLTRFFAAAPHDLAQTEDVPASHPARKLFHRWLGLVERRAWSALFKSLLEETGLLVRESITSDGGERRLANLRHIFGVLEQAAYEHDLDLLALLDVLNDRRQEAAADDSDLQPIETERPKVRIMTVHASKGLEFPVVFLAGGFTSAHGGDYLVYRDAENDAVLDLRKSGPGKAAAERDREQEQRRLLYVALTRAMFKLYLPVAAGTHSPGPVAKILRPALEVFGLEHLTPTWVKKLDPDEVTVEVSKAKEWGRSYGPAVPRLSIGSELFPRLDDNLHRRRIHIRSFSSLHRQQARPEKANYLERPPRADDDAPGALEVPDPLRGPVFGDMVHNILEDLDFALAGAAAEPGQLLLAESRFRQRLDAEIKVNLPKLQSRVPRDLLEDACRKQIAELVWKTLRTPLRELGEPLCKVPTRDRIQEVEFLFPDALPGQDGFLTGFMDMVVRQNNRFFLVDWKTNWLESYEPAALAQCMDQSDYIRQYRLYLQALSRWLSKMCGDFDFDRDLGGVYYLFLRGMNGRDESTGVFFHPPDTADLVLENVLETVSSRS